MLWDGVLGILALGFRSGRPLARFYECCNLEDEALLHQLGAKMLPGIFMGYLLHAEGGMLVADWGDIENCESISDIHIKYIQVT